MITVNRKALLKALRDVKPAVTGKRTYVACTQYVHLAQHENVLTVTANNLDIAIQVKVDGSGEGIVVLPHRELMATIKSMSGTAITLTPGKITCDVSDGNTSITMPTLEAAEFPPSIPGETTDVLVATNELWQRALNHVIPAIATDLARPTLNHACVHSNGDYVNMVGTDGYRLAIAPLSGVLYDNILIPIAALKASKRLHKKGDGIVISQTTDKAQGVILGDNGRIIFQGYEGNYPDYAKIVPQGYNVAFEASPQPWASLIELAMLSNGDDTIYEEMIGLRLDGDHIDILDANRKEVGAIPANIVDNDDNGPYEIYLNGKYTIDAIASMNEETPFTFTMTTSSRPATFEQRAYKTVIMPMHNRALEDERMATGRNHV